jgi:hypothetical protein
VQSTVNQKQLANLARLIALVGSALIRTRTARSILRDSFALLLFESCNHLLHTTMLATRGKDFQTFFLRTPLQDVDVDIADTPVSDL